MDNTRYSNRESHRWRRLRLTSCGCCTASYGDRYAHTRTQHTIRRPRTRHTKHPHPHPLVNTTISTSTRHSRTHRHDTDTAMCDFQPYGQERHQVLDLRVTPAAAPYELLAAHTPYGHGQAQTGRHGRRDTDGGWRRRDGRDCEK